MALQTANQFRLNPNIASNLGGGVQTGQNIAGQFQLGKQRDQQIQQTEEDATVKRFLNSALELSAVPDDQKLSALKQNRAAILARGGETSDTDAGIALAEAGDFETLNNQIQGIITNGERRGLIKPLSSLTGLTSEQREFAALSKQAGLSDDEISQAIKVKFGLEARAGESAAERISRTGAAEDIAKSEAEIVQAKEEAKLQAQLKLKPTIESKIEKAKGDAKASTEIVNESFKRIGNITANVRNIDRAINAIDRGAKTGVIAKLVPSITAASRELRQIQNELGLDVIGSVTFGALSQGELDLALETAIDLGLEPDALKEVLGRKKEAQNKLIGYLDQQIQFLDNGGTLAGWREEQKQASAPQEVEAPVQQKQGGQVMVDANGNRAMVFPDGSFEEL